MLKNLTLAYEILIPRFFWDKIPLNHDGSVTDTGKFFIGDEIGYYAAHNFIFTWFGFAFALQARPLTYWDEREIPEKEYPNFIKVEKINDKK